MHYCIEVNYELPVKIYHVLILLLHVHWHKTNNNFHERNINTIKKRNDFLIKIDHIFQFCRGEYKILGYLTACHINWQLTATQFQFALPFLPLSLPYLPLLWIPSILAANTAVGIWEIPSHVGRYTARYVKLTDLEIDLMTLEMFKGNQGWAKKGWIVTNRP